jgi:hypothetical protein
VRCNIVVADMIFCDGSGVLVDGVQESIAYSMFTVASRVRVRRAFSVRCLVAK